jgi:hypothetical protein
MIAGAVAPAEVNTPQKQQHIADDTDKSITVHVVEHAGLQEPDVLICGLVICVDNYFSPSHALPGRTFLGYMAQVRAQRLHRTDAAGHIRDRPRT